MMPLSDYPDIEPMAVRNPKDGVPETTVLYAVILAFAFGACAGWAYTHIFAEKAAASAYFTGYTDAVNGYGLDSKPGRGR